MHQYCTLKTKKHCQQLFVHVKQGTTAAVSGILLAFSLHGDQPYTVIVLRPKTRWWTSFAVHLWLGPAAVQPLPQAFTITGMLRLATCH